AGSRLAIEHDYRATVRFDSDAAEGQAQPPTGPSSRLGFGFQLNKGVEDALPQGDGHAGSAVPHFETQLASRVLSTDAHDAAFWSVSNRVFDEVGQQSTQEVLVALKRDRWNGLVQTNCAHRRLELEFTHDLFG